MKTAGLLIAALMTTTSAVSAETLRWARAGDALTVDPHAQNEGPTHALSQQIYEPLVLRDNDGNFVPTLATEWSVNEDHPNVWTFKLREGVTFHDGSDWSAPIRWSSFNVSAWSAFGLSGQCIWVPALGITGRCAA